MTKAVSDVGGRVPSAPGDMDDEPQIGDARQNLRCMLVAAGIPGPSVLVDWEDPAKVIALPPLSSEKAMTLADLVQQAMSEHFMVAQELKAAFDFLGVTVVIDVIDHHLSLGAVSASAAHDVAVALGAPLLDGEVDYNDWSTAKLIADRLAGRVRAVTDGPEDQIIGSLRECSGTPAVFLGRVGLEEGKKLAQALKPRSAR